MEDTILVLSTDEDGLVAWWLLPGAVLGLGAGHGIGRGGKYPSC